MSEHAAHHPADQSAHESTGIAAAPATTTTATAPTATAAAAMTAGRMIVGQQFIEMGGDELLTVDGTEAWGRNRCGSASSAWRAAA